MQPPLSLGKLRYRSNKYRDAMTKTEQCKVPKDGKITSKYEQWLTKEYNEYCLKSKSANIIMCPQKIINQPSNIHLKLVNNYFTNLGKKSKKTEKKGEEKKNKKTKKGKEKKNKKKKKSKKNKSMKKKKQSKYTMVDYMLDYMIESQ